MYFVQKTVQPLAVLQLTLFPLSQVLNLCTIIIAINGIILKTPTNNLLRGQ